MNVLVGSNIISVQCWNGKLTKLLNLVKLIGSVTMSAMNFFSQMVMDCRSRYDSPRQSVDMVTAQKEYWSKFLITWLSSSFTAQLGLKREPENVIREI